MGACRKNASNSACDIYFSTVTNMATAVVRKFVIMSQKFIAILRVYVQ
jgi:hypothetical protein